MSAKRLMRLDQIDITQYAPGEREKVGTLGWDSRTGQLWGTLAGAIRQRAAEAEGNGWAWVPGPVPSSRKHRITDPLRKPNELAAIIASFHYDVPKELLRFYHPRKVDHGFKKSGLKRMRDRGEEIVY